MTETKEINVYEKISKVYPIVPYRKITFKNSINLFK